MMADLSRSSDATLTFRDEAAKRHVKHQAKAQAQKHTLLEKNYYA